MIFLHLLYFVYSCHWLQISLSVGTRTQIHAHTTRMIWTFLLTVTTYFAVRSSYIFLIPVLFNTVAFIIISFLNLFFSRKYIFLKIINNVENYKYF